MDRDYMIHLYRDDNPPLPLALRAERIAAHETVAKLLVAIGLAERLDVEFGHGK